MSLSEDEAGAATQPSIVPETEPAVAAVAEEAAENIGEEDDDDFDAFNEPGDDEDSDFGDFGDFEQGGPSENVTSNTVLLEDHELEDTEQFKLKLDSLLDEIFTGETTAPASQNDQLLDERSAEIFAQLSRVPHLKPNNWIKSQIRHNLLIKLGIPINLDELIDEKVPTPHEHAQRRKSVNEQDINWEGFEIPDLESLNLSSDKIATVVNSTEDILSKIETDNLNNTSQSYLESLKDQGKLDEKLKQLQENNRQLIQLSSVWNHELQEHKKNFDIYESVVQNLIGYSQKLERDEILANIEQLKKKGKRKSVRK